MQEERKLDIEATGSASGTCMHLNVMTNHNFDWSTPVKVVYKLRV